MPLRSLISALTLLAATALLPAAIHADPPAPARPLRIWVMHNEIGAHDEPVTEARIRNAIEKWHAEENIIIENSVRNLLMSREIAEAQPFADYIIGDNQILKELKRFQQHDASDEPIAIEFIRWNDAYSRLTSALSSNDPSTAPDIIQIGSTWTAALADSGLLADVTGVIDTNDFFPPSIASAKIRGDDRLHAVPWFVDTRLLFYRKDLIHAPAELETWERYLATGKRLEDDGHVLVGFQHTITWDLLHNLTPWLWSAGGGIIDTQQVGPANIHRVVLDAPASIEAMTFLKSLATRGYAEFISVNQETLEDEFIEGRYATIFAGPWLAKRLGNNWQAHYGAALPPAGPKGSFPFVGGSHLAISGLSKKRGTFQRAVNLVQHLTSPDSQLRYAARTGLLPAHRHTLSNYLKGPHADTVRRALEVGRSYPSMPAWGSIVENELTRSHIWHIWRDIAHGVSDTTLEHTASQAATELRKKVLISSMTRSAPYAFGLVGGLVFLGVGFTLWWRRRYTTIRQLYEQKTGELKKLVADRAILEGKTLLLQQCRDEQSGTLRQLERNLSRMKRKAVSLTTEITKLTALRAHADRKTIGIFSIHSDGTLCLDNEPVHFENNRQARRLIEHMVRLATNGTTSIHCVWGYALFGWDANKIQTPPQRLFEALVSKINGSLKKRGRPPLIGKAARGVGLWKFLWNTNSIMEHSDINRAVKRADAAARYVEEGLIEKACEEILAALELDPKNMEVLSLMDALRTKSPEQFAHHEHHLNALWKISEKLLRDDLTALRHGMCTVEEMLAGDRVPRGIDLDTAHDEFRSMKFHVEYATRRSDNIFGERGDRRKSPFVDDLTGQLIAVRNEIVSLKSMSPRADHLWASVVDSDSFGKLMAFPNIKTIVNNFHNSETNEREDPRLVQLALISVLSSPDTLSAINTADSEHDLFATIRRGLGNEMRGLEQQLSTIPLS